MSLVRSELEYAVNVWHPYCAPDVNKLERVQRRAARYMRNNYSPHSSVTQMQSDLERRDENVSTLLFCIK